MKKISNMSVKKRLLVLITLVIFLFSALVIRLIYVQVIQSGDLTGKAFYQWARDLPLRADRGLIKDSNGVVLVDNQNMYDVYIRPNSLGDPAQTARVIAEATGNDYDAVLEKVSKKGTSEVTVVKQITKNMMTVIEKQRLKGVYFGISSARYYPYGEYMTQVLGFTDADNLGQTGVEAYYNDYLKGTDGQILTETDLVGKEIEGSTAKYIPSISGMDVNLTLDYQIQSFAERAVSQAMLKYSAKGAMCLVMNPQTGAIYAMAQAPSFDLNNIPRDNLDYLFESSKNGFVTGVYEPGSTFKILTSAIGLEEHTFSDSHSFYCPGYRMVDGQRIKCWRSLGHGSQNFAEGVANSCNCVFMDIATTVGPSVMYDYFEKFGLFEKTGIDVVGETRAILLKEENVKTVDIARIGFGQAIAITPIQLARAVSGIITGNLPTPHIVSSITDKSGKTVYNKQAETGRQVVSPETGAKMRSLLENVVINGGGKNAGVAGFSIGGKTGTAQKYGEGGGIAQGKYISSFIGFSSVENPEYLCLMIVDEPQGYEYYGSLVAAPFVSEVYANIFAYKGIKPAYKEGEAPVDFVMPDLVGKSVAEAFSTLKKLGVHYEYAGDGGNILYQMPAAGSKANTNTVAFLQLSQG